jgi:hypothetical protein
MKMRALIIVVLVMGSLVAAYQNLRWDCHQPGGGVAGHVWPFKDVYFYPYMNCVSRWPNFSDHWPRGTEPR